MRTMEIRRFRRKIKITDLEPFIKGRLINDLVLWPDQALPLVGYMAWPNDENMRNRWLEVHRSDNQSDLDALRRKLKIIQQHWARAADIVHVLRDMVEGQHQQWRGGASVGKAIAVVAASAKSKGTGRAKLWQIWKIYKDVAPLITAAVLVSAEAQTRHRQAPYGIKLHQFQPYRMGLLMPELVLSVAMAFENFGLQHVAHGRTEPLFDPESLWRIPTDINLTLIGPPARKITQTDIAVLNARRAGNRGKANRSETTPVLD